MITEARVRFCSDGHWLSGTLVRPADQREPSPAVAISHGWSGAVNERVLPLASKLAEAGYVALAFDHRGFGESEGPRARCDPQEQVRDLSNALTFLGTEPGVDPERLGLIGVSFGGAIVTAAAATDERAKATACIVGMGSGERWLRSLQSDEQWARLTEEVRADQGEIVRTGRGARVDFSTLMPLPPSDAVEAELGIMRRKYPEGYPLENVWLAARFRPEETVDRIAPRAILFLTCKDDTVVSCEESRAMFERARDPKALVMFPTGGHGGPLGPLVADTAKVTISFFDEHLQRAP